ncbi:MAG: hypothetical protein WDO13_12885 [Verrucomicrobiota bacterium]
MPEDDAVRFLQRNGLRKTLALGDSFGWSDSFDWSSDDHATLALRIEPKPFGPGGDWVNGHLKGASLFYPGGREVSIPLGKAPKH